MFTIDALDDHPKTKCVARKHAMGKGLVDPARVVEAAEEYKNFLKDKFGIHIDRGTVIARCEVLPR